MSDTIYTVLCTVIFTLAAVIGVFLLYLLYISFDDDIAQLQKQNRDLQAHLQAQAQDIRSL